MKMGKWMALVLSVAMVFSFHAPMSQAAAVNEIDSLSFQSIKAQKIVDEIKSGTLNSQPVMEIPIDEDVFLQNPQSAIQTALNHVFPNAGENGGDGTSGGSGTSGEDSTQNGPGYEEGKYVALVRVPAGHYELDGPIYIPDDTILDCTGDGVNQAEFYPTEGNGGCVLFGGKNAQDAQKSHGYEYYQNMTVIGGVFHGDTYSPNGAAYAKGIQGCNVKFGHAQNINLIGMTVLNNCGAKNRYLY